MKALKIAMRHMARSDPKALDDLLEGYVIRPSYLPPGRGEEPMSPEEVAFREGERALAKLLVDLAHEDNDE